MLFVWPILFTTFMILHFTPPLINHSLPNSLIMNYGFLYTVIYAGFYVCLDVKAGSFPGLLCFFCWFFESSVAHQLGFSIVWKGIYKGYLVERYGEDESQHPRFDESLWSCATRATRGKNKGKLYGLSNISDPLCFITGTPSSSCNSTSNTWETRPRDIKAKQNYRGVGKRKRKGNGRKEKEKSEKEKEKTEKEAMLKRMTSIEAMLRLITKTSHRRVRK